MSSGYDNELEIQKDSELFKTTDSSSRQSPELTNPRQTPALRFPFIWKVHDYPAVDYSSWSSFRQTFWIRLKAIFNRRFLLIVLWGQILSFCISATGVCTTELGMRNWSAPTTQSFFVYFVLFCIYTPYTVWSYGFKAWAKMLWTDGWRYIILAAVDVEANYAAVKAYQYTNILSAQLINAWATPCCMLVVYFLVRHRYHWSQILGALVAIVGLVLLVLSDFLGHGGSGASDKPTGDGFAFLAATLYGVSNGLEEYLVRNRPLYEVVGQLGMWGTIINGAQAAGLEHKQWTEVITWSGANIGFLVAFAAAMLVIYTTAPLLFRVSSSPFYNLSLLTSNFWALMFGFGLYQLSTYWLYGLAFPLVIIGLVIYFSCSAPTNQTGKEFVIEGRGKKAKRVNNDIA